MGYELEDTIVAQATAVGQGLRAVVRSSGARVREVFSALCGPLPAAANHPLALAVAVQLPGFRRPVPGELWLWWAPRSYTGEDVAELHLPGSVALVDAVLECCLRLGCRLADPGEFTLRAFLHGKLDLTQAEAVASLVSAHDETTFRTALEQMSGGLRGPLEKVREHLFDVLVELEAELDFAEEDIEFLDRSVLVRTLHEARHMLGRIEQQMHRRPDYTPWPRLVLTGPPNAGKSSLFNALARRELALVSPVPGTTRDYLRALLPVADHYVELIDTAGVETRPDTLTELAQQARQHVTESASLLLHCVPCDELLRGAMVKPCNNPDRDWFVATKADLVSEEERDRLLEEARRRGYHYAVGVTVVREEGTEALEEAFHDWIMRGVRPSPGAIVPETAARCRDAVARALAALDAALQSAAVPGAEELLASDVRVALEEIGQILGAVHTEQILDAIFSRFCIGK
jgi:tRNA modification GTPase